MDSEVSITKPSYPFLALVGFERFEENFVEFSKNVIINSKLDSNSLVNGLILELWSLVEVQTAFNIPLSPGNIQEESLLSELAASYSSGHLRISLETLSRSMPIPEITKLSRRELILAVFLSLRLGKWGPNF